MTTLIISEKNKAAKAIAEALGNTQIIKKSKYISIYYISSKDIYVVPLRGHILQYENSNSFKSWSKTNPRNIITDPNSIKKVPISISYPYISILKEISKLCDLCVIGTDADVEGCNIGLFDAFPYVKSVNSNIKISQLWLSSLEEKEIQDKFNQLIPPKWNWGESGEARAIIDAIVGFSATREFTVTYKNVTKSRKKGIISIGRVQTALLYQIYLRDELIKSFIPENYWIIDADLKVNGDIFKANHKLNPFKKDQAQVAKQIYFKIRDEKKAIILDTSKFVETIKPPTPLNTSKALVLLTKTLKINARSAFEALNQLYLNKLISYPRTDSDIYKDNFDHFQYIKKFGSHSDYGLYTADLLKRKRFQPTRGKIDAGDHPPITPIESVELNSKKFKTEIQKKVYDIIARYYLALFGKEGKESKTTINLEIKEELFVSKITALIEEGFLSITPFLRKNYDREIVIKDKHLPVKSISLIEKKTQPPPYYSDSTLLKMMEHDRLGTKSTRPIIIEILIKRGFIVSKNRAYYITSLGRFLIDSLKEIWLPFLKSDFTRFIEGLLDDIKENKKNRNDAVNIARNTFLELFDKFISKKSEFTLKLEKLTKSLEQEEKKDTKSYSLSNIFCPSCKKPSLMIVQNSSGYRNIACSTKDCNYKTPIPKVGIFQVLNTKCSICGFNAFKFTRKKQKKQYVYYICPNCWKTKAFCSECNDYAIEKDLCVKKQKSLI